jgi:hypothetical protein
MDPTMAGTDRGDRNHPAGLHAFGRHLVLYFIAIVVLVPVNLLLAPDYLYVMWPLLGWGVFVAFHAARVMGILPNRPPQP